MADSTDEVIPAGWEKRLSRSTGNDFWHALDILLSTIRTVFIFDFCFVGMHYYLNVYTKESQWDPPTAPAEGSSSVSIVFDE